MEIFRQDWTVLLVGFESFRWKISQALLLNSCIREERKKNTFESVSWRRLCSTLFSDQKYCTLEKVLCEPGRRYHSKKRENDRPMVFGIRFVQGLGVLTTTIAKYVIFPFFPRAQLSTPPLARYPKPWIQAAT